jgi:nicotinate-nucleotide adenylyltransferase
MAKPIGILGGTFDPVHHGHLRLALEVYQSCALAEVRLVPLHTPSHRQSPATLPEQRLQMLNLAIEKVEGLVVDERELQRGDVSFTVDTLRSLRKELRQQPLCLIMGMDAFQTLHKWHEWTSLLDYAHIIVARRPGSDLKLANAKVSEFYKKNITTELSDVHTQEAGKILDISIAELDISSTRIRELISTRQDVHYLLPEDVISYIEQEDLYHRY